MEEITNESQNNNNEKMTFTINRQKSYSRGELLLRSFFGFFYIMLLSLYLDPEVSGLPFSNKFRTSRRNMLPNNHPSNSGRD